MCSKNMKSVGLELELPGVTSLEKEQGAKFFFGVMYACASNWCIQSLPMKPSKRMSWLSPTVINQMSHVHLLGDRLR